MQRNVETGKTSADAALPKQAMFELCSRRSTHSVKHMSLVSVHFFAAYEQMNWNYHTFSR